MITYSSPFYCRSFQNISLPFNSLAIINLGRGPDPLEPTGLRGTVGSCDGVHLPLVRINEELLERKITAPV
jgi:hypothetical protein